MYLNQVRHLKIGKKLANLSSLINRLCVKLFDNSSHF